MECISLPERKKEKKKERKKGKYLNWRFYARGLMFNLNLE